MANQELQLTRAELARFLGDDQDLIIRFERLLEQAGDALPNDIDNLLNQVISAATRSIQNDQNYALLINEISPYLPRQVVNEAVDYLVFDKNAPVPQEQGNVSWNSARDTLNIFSKGGLSIHVGLSSYAIGRNSSVVDIVKGEVVGFDGAVNGVLAFEKYIANGSMPAITIIGIAAEDIAAGETGKVQEWGELLDVDTTNYNVGEILYASPTVAGGLTNIRPLSPQVVIPVGVSLVDSATGSFFIRITIEQQLNHGEFVKNTDQPIVTADTAEIVTGFTETRGSGVELVGNKIYVRNSGVYDFSTSAQIQSSSASSKDIWLWARKNGVSTAVENSTLRATIADNHFALSSSKVYSFSLQADDYIEVLFASDSTGVKLAALPATTFAPESPAMLVRVSQVVQ